MCELYATPQTIGLSEQEPGCADVLRSWTQALSICRASVAASIALALLIEMLPRWLGAGYIQDTQQCRNAHQNDKNRVNKVCHLY